MAKVNPKKYKKKHAQTRKTRQLLMIGAGLALVLLGVWAMDLGGLRSQTMLQVSGTPDLQVDKELVDLGEVKLGTPVEVSFELTNTGEGPLRFTKAPFVEAVEGC